MGVVKFCVSFDKPDKVYYSGEKMTGRVELVTNSVMKIRSVQLKIEGRAKCKWYYRKKRYREASEIYIMREEILIGGRAKSKLPKGEYTYPFAIMLPDKTPSSFSGRYGEISYFAKVKIDIPFGFDKKERTEFIVINPLNLNLFPNLTKPYRNEKSMTFFCLCTASGPLTTVVHLPKTAFAPTESIPITLEVDNASNVTVNAVHVCLKRTLCYIADKHIKKKDMKLQKLRLGRVAEDQSQTWSENITIPSILFPNLDCCTIIKMYHELQIKVVASGLHSDLHMYVPVTITDVVVLNDSEVPIYPKNNGGDPFEELFSKFCPSASPDPVITQPRRYNAPSNPDFAGGVPHMPAQENSTPVLQYPPQAHPALLSLPPQRATNPKYSQNAPHPKLADVVAGYGLAFPSLIQ